MGGPDLLGAAVGVEVADAGGPSACPVDEHVGHVGLGLEPAPPGPQGPAQRGHGIALGVDRAPEGAEPAVVAGRAVVVGDRVDPGGRPVGVQAVALGGLGGEDGTEHVRAGGHRVRARAPGRERVGSGLARRADQALGLGVVRLELGVVEGPVGQRGPVDRAPGAEQGEVLLTEAGQLAVGVGAAAAHRGREVVDVAGEQAVAVGLGAAERPGLDQRVRAQEVALGELDLVVGELTLQPVRRVQVEEVVATLLQDHHRPARGGEDVGEGRPARPAPDDDGVGVHGQPPVITSSSVQPRGWTSPRKATEVQPARSRFPP